MPLPGDVVEQVFGYLDVVDLVRSTRVCVLWRERGKALIKRAGEDFVKRLFVDPEGALERVKWRSIEGGENASILGPPQCGVYSLLRAMELGKPKAVETSYRPLIPPESTVIPLSKRKHLRAYSKLTPSAPPPPCDLTLLCYSIPCSGSIQSLVRHLRTHEASLTSPCILVGTKCDLPPDPLTTDLANILSHILSIPHVRTSAKTGEGISQLKRLLATQCGSQCEVASRWCCAVA